MVAPAPTQASSDKGSVTTHASELPIQERDIAFVIFDQLQLESRALGYDAFKHLSREDIELILQEGFRFAREKVWPTNAVADREGCRWEAGKVTVPSVFKELVAAYRESGWLTLTRPEDQDGAGMPLTVAIAVSEAMVAGNLAFSPYPGLTRGVARLIESFGADWQRQVIARRLFDMEWFGTMCLSEPSIGTALGDLRTLGTKTDEPGIYHVQGTKIFISGGDHDLADNIVHLVLGRTPDAPKGIKGLSLFLVPRTWFDRSGKLGESNDVYCERVEEKMGLHGSATCVMNYGENGKCRGYLLGEEGKGIEIMFNLMNEARIGTGLHGLATGAVSYQLAEAYAAERVQGVELQNMRDVDAPRVTINRHPDVRRMLHTMRAQVAGMRALIYRAASFADDAFEHPDQAVRERRRKLLELLTPICKSHCSDTGFDVGVMAMQTFGGAGYTQEYPVEQLIRDVKVASIYEGANGIQALDLIGRKLAKNNGEYFQIFVEEVEAVIAAHRAHPRLGPLCELLAAELDRLKATTAFIGGEGLSGRLPSAVLYASPYLTMFGNVVFGWLLLEQAVIAHDKLGAMLIERDVRTPSARDELVASSDQAAFYDGKLRTASFFLRSVLPQNLGLAAIVEHGDRDILRGEP